MKKSVYVLLVICIGLWAACNQKKAPVQVDVTQQDTLKVEKPEPVVEQKVKIDRGVNLEDKYFLIFNSYTVEEFAQEWNRNFQKKGYKSNLVMRNDNGYYCLALESYNDMKLAKEAMNRLREEPGMEDVWIMER